MTTEDDFKKSLRETDWGKLLVRCGFEPYNTESLARRVAEKAAEELKALQTELEELKKDRDQWKSLYLKGS